MAFLMKGKVYGERKHLLKFPVIAEVKYDEIRLHVKMTDQGPVFLSYAEKPLYNLDRWKDVFWEFMHKFGYDNLDMGVLVNKNFNDSYRWVRSSRGAPKELNEGMVEFFLFDLPDYTGTAYEVRKPLRTLAVEALRNTWGLAAFVPEAKVIEDEAALDEYFYNVRSRGYEGLMVKSLDHTYQPGKRIDGWLKMKPEETFDGCITGVNQAFAEDGTPHDRAGSVTVVLEDGSTASPAGLEWGLARAMWADPSKYIGQWVEFKCMERDRQGGYRHPSFVRFREPKL